MGAVEILPNLWLGNIRDALNQDFLHRKKITCVVNCTVKYPFYTSDKIRKIRIPVRDTGKEPEFYKMYVALPSAVDKIYELLDSERILIHCYAGKQRSVAVILAFIMKHCKYPLDYALHTLRAKWPCVGRLNFTKSLVMYQSDLENDGIFIPDEFHIKRRPREDSQRYHRDMQ